MGIFAILFNELRIVKGVGTTAKRKRLETGFGALRFADVGLAAGGGVWRCSII
jgi:hypothetical protein